MDNGFGNAPFAVVSLITFYVTGSITSIGSQVVSILVSVLTAVVVGLLSKAIGTFVQGWLKRRRDRHLRQWRERARAAEDELRKLKADAS